MTSKPASARSSTRFERRPRIFSAQHSCSSWTRETAAIASVAVFGARKIDKYVDIHRESKLRNSMIYDRSLGMYWETKRPLTTNQRLVIETRHKGGEPYGKILSDMRLLKR